jgi:DNA-binding CsgD family transcriptional regulator/sugar lactone lactonase YvrE
MLRRLGTTPSGGDGQRTHSVPLLWYPFLPDTGMCMHVGLTGGVKARLTRRELEVADLVAQGLTNREIAQRLFISERTADGHLEHIRDKLGVGTRAQITAWLVRQETAAHEPASVELTTEPASRRKRLAGHRLWVATAATIIVAVSGGFVAWAAVGLFARPSGPTISTVAGTDAVAHGIAGGYSGDHGLATEAQLYGPRDVAVGPDGIVYIADSGNRVVRRIGKDGSIITLAGGGRAPLADGALATSVALGYPSNLVVDSGGRLYVSTNVDGDLQVWTVKPDSTMMRVIYGLSKARSDAEQASGWNQPVGGLALAADGTLYIADRAASRVWKRTPDGAIRAFAGTGQAGYSGDGGASSGAQLDSPVGLALDDDGNLYIADSGNNRIRKVDVRGVIATVAGSRADYGDSGDGGKAVQAQLSVPLGVAVGRDGVLFIADTGNNRLRKVTATGVIVGLAGTGHAGFVGDGAAAGQAQLSGPSAVALDSRGDLLVADTVNNRIRKLVRP